MWNDTRGFIHPSVRPFIFCFLSGLPGQQLSSSSRRTTEAFIRQLRDVISPVVPGSALRTPSSGTCPKQLPLSMSRWHPDQMPGAHHSIPFRGLYSRFHSFGHYPQLLTIGSVDWRESSASPFSFDLALTRQHAHLLVSLARILFLNWLYMN